MTPTEPALFSPAFAGHPPPPREGSVWSGISIIVPTYREAENLPELIERIDQVRQEHDLTVELLIMDDQSNDGTEDLVASLDKDWVRLIVRTRDRGLSPAVVDGLRAARHDTLVVMDADLSHPPERIPDLVQALADGGQFAIGSRYVEGGSTDAEWGLFRRLNSRVATWLARPLTAARDPMAGFFALLRDTFEKGEADLNPVGYKIGLELLVKCGCEQVREVPIHFRDRTRGSSKLSFTEQLRYLRHLRRLYVHRYGTWTHLAQFLAVGLSGIFVNLAVLTVLLGLSVPEKVAVAGGILVSMVSNFVLNRRITFSYARHESAWRQFVGFVGACSLGALVNYAVTLAIQPLVGLVQVAALVGIVAGTGFNFLCTRFLVFRLRPARREA